MAVDLGSKTTITFATSTLNTTAFEVTGASINGVSRKVIPTSHFLTAVADTFIPSDRYDGGELTLQMHMDRDAFKVIMAELYGTGSTAPTTVNSETVTILLGGVIGDDMTLDVFVTNTDFDIPDEEKMVVEMTFKVTGNVEFPTA